MMIAVLSDPKCSSNMGQVGARTGSTRPSLRAYLQVMRGSGT